MAKVLNKHTHGIPPGAVYIGRGSPFGNPFVLGRDGSREEVVSKFMSYFMNNDSLKKLALEKLRDKDLVCFCAPKLCHGDVLLKYVQDRN